jgi:peptidoglycan/xylan/chitin deacetylase (PgdA/CDA1 family)
MIRKRRYWKSRTRELEADSDFSAGVVTKMRKPLFGFLWSAVLYAARTLGLFWLSRRLTARGLRILCYHGFSESDEHLFRPLTFIRSQTFRARLKYLVHNRYPVLPLGEAIRRSHDGSLPAGATVITIDDGFSSAYRHAIPALAEVGFPATIYMTTYQTMTRIPAFALAIRYMFWKTAVPEITLDGVGDLIGRAPLATPVARERTARDVISYGATLGDEYARDEVTRRVAKRLKVDYRTLRNRRSLDLMTPEEIRLAVDAGVDIQVHTHRHRFPLDREEAYREIEECRSVLRPIAKTPLVHFCYPSGIWSEQRLPWLADMGIETAVTCDQGLNYSNTHPLTLRRFLDSDSLSMIEFEAELCGFKEIVRRGRAIWRRARR